MSQLSVGDGIEFEDAGSWGASTARLTPQPVRRPEKKGAAGGAQLSPLRRAGNLYSA